MASLPPRSSTEIVERTDGVPLFVEELTKAVLEAGAARGQDGRYVAPGPLPPLAIPATLQASLMARLDRLGPAQGSGADRRRDRPRVLLRAARRGGAARATLSSRRARSAGRRRSGLPPRCAAAGHLPLQARARPGRGLQHAAARPAPGAARDASRHALEANSRRSPKRSRRCCSSSYRSEDHRQCDRLLAEGGGAVAATVGRHRSGPAPFARD